MLKMAFVVVVSFSMTIGNVVLRASDEELDEFSSEIAEGEEENSEGAQVIRLPLMELLGRLGARADGDGSEPSSKKRKRSSPAVSYTHLRAHET